MRWEIGDQMGRFGMRVEFGDEGENGDVWKMGMRREEWGRDGGRDLE